MLTSVDVHKRVRANIRQLLRDIATMPSHPNRPACSEHPEPTDGCEECDEIAGCLRRLADLPDSKGDALKLLIESAVRRGLAEALEDGGYTSTVLESLWADGFLKGCPSKPGDPDPLEGLADPAAAVRAELKRLGVGRVTTTEFASSIGVCFDEAAAGEAIVKLIRLSASRDVPLRGIEIRRTGIAVKTDRPLTPDEHAKVREVCRDHSRRVLGAPLREELESHWAEQERREADRQSLAEAIRLQTWKTWSYGGHNRLSAVTRTPPADDADRVHSSLASRLSAIADKRVHGLEPATIKPGWYWARWRGSASDALANSGPGPWAPIYIEVDSSDPDGPWVTNEGSLKLVLKDYELGPMLAEQGPP